MNKVDRLGGLHNVCMLSQWGGGLAGEDAGRYS